MAIWLGIAAIILLGVVVAAFNANSNLSDIKSKFVALGSLAGKSKSEIVEVVGAPNSVSSMGDGGSLLQWQHISEAGAYHIALIFDADDICGGVTHEHSS